MRTQWHWRTIVIGVWAMGLWSGGATEAAPVQPWSELRDMYPRTIEKAATDASLKWQVEIERAKLGRDPQEKTALAWRIYDDALGQEDEATAAMTAQLCYDFGSKQPGCHAPAIRAMELMASRNAEWRFFFFEKAAAAMEQWLRALRGEDKSLLTRQIINAHRAVADDRYLAGDDVNASKYYRRAMALARQTEPELIPPMQQKLDHAVLHIEAANAVKKELESLARNDKDVIAKRNLMRLHLIGHDDPEAASAYLDHSFDAEDRKLIPVAARPMELVDAAACLTLGEWYVTLDGRVKQLGLNAEAAPAGEQNMRFRAAQYLSRYLSLDRRATPQRQRALTLLKALDPALASSAPAADGNAPPPPVAPPPVAERPADDAKPDAQAAVDVDPDTEAQAKVKVRERRRSLRSDWYELKPKEDEKRRPSFFDIPIGS